MFFDEINGKSVYTDEFYFDEIDGNSTDTDIDKPDSDQIDETFLDEIEETQQILILMNQTPTK